MCVDFHAYLSGVTHMRQELTVWQIKSHFSIVCRFYLFSLILLTIILQASDWRTHELKVSHFSDYLFFFLAVASK
jgi:hypothetical protein